MVTTHGIQDRICTFTAVYILWIPLVYSTDIFDLFRDEKLDEIIDITRCVSFQAEIIFSNCIAG
ncbi:hypothetical protein CI610_00881 [invertebrate metagenome]|uniref:Uncharacterized protein n=1 Tax=invertebrate metagenome TaxID=1711999 RepID=A0A2H9TA92_9ZZZZ